MTLTTAPVTEAARPAPIEFPLRNTRLLQTRASLALGWAGVVLGALFIWWNPGRDDLVDAALSPLVAALLYVIVSSWTDTRGAKAAVMLYAVLLVVSLTVLNSSPASVTTRNFRCTGSDQLLVGLGALCLLEHLALPPLAWSLLLVFGSGFYPQFVFIPLLMMTLLRSRSLLVIGFVDKARGVALRCAALCLLVLAVKKGYGIGHIRVDAITLPLAWWISSWLLDGEPLMPLFWRIVLAAILSVVSIAGFQAWPAMALILLSAFAFGRGSAPGEASSSPAGQESVSGNGTVTAPHN